MSGPLRWKLLAGFVLVFIAGLVAGAFVGAAESRQHSRMDFGHHDSLTQRIRERMQARLDLTPEQVAKTAPIFDKTARQLETIRTETRRRVHEAFVAADNELAPDLTPEQRVKLKALEAKHGERNAPRGRPDSPHP